MNSPHVIFESDSPGDHFPLIIQGIRSHFESSGSPVRFLPLAYSQIQGMGIDDSALGIIAWVRNENLVRVYEKRGVAYLNLFESKMSSSFGGLVRFEGEGSIAADYFVRELDCAHLAFFGNVGIPSSQRRLTEFRNRAREYSVEVDECMASNRDFGLHGSDSSETAANRFWMKVHQALKEMPKPLGVFCVNNLIGLSVRYHAESLGYSVPGDINILGIAPARPFDGAALSSVSYIQLNHEAQGRSSAEMIEAFLIHRKVSDPICLPPDGIIHRGTTLPGRVEDALIRRAITEIQKDSSITVTVLCQKLGVSRRFLEKRFRKAVNMTTAKAIDYERFKSAKQLMRHSDYKYDAIAGLAGYSSGKQMRRSFQRFTRMSPRQFRENAQASG